MMGEVKEEKKFVCNFCGKKCSSGRSLGGHMRWPFIVCSGKNDKIQGEINTDCEDDDHSNCSLKESPDFIKRPRSKPCDKEGFSCKECGKKFSSSRGVCGHMRTHSKKDCEENPDFISEFEDQELKKRRRMSDFNRKACNEGRFLCKEYGNKFLSSQGIAGRVRKHSKKGKLQAESICTKCDKIFDSTQALIGHMRIHSEKIKSLNNTDGLAEFMICYPKKKRSMTRRMISEDNSGSSAKESAFDVDLDKDDADAAVGLVMLSMGVRESPIHAVTYEHLDRSITTVDRDQSLGHVDEMEKHVQKPKSGLLGCQKGQALGGHNRAPKVEDTTKDSKVENEGLVYIPRKADCNGTHGFGVSLKWTTGCAYQCVPMAISYREPKSESSFSVGGLSR